MADTTTCFATLSAPDLVSLFWIARDHRYVTRGCGIVHGEFPWVVASTSDRPSPSARAKYSKPGAFFDGAGYGMTLSAPLLLYTVPLANPLVLVGRFGSIRKVFVPPTL